MDVTQMVRGSEPIGYPALARGYINSTPSTFTEGVDVILPAGSTERHYGPCKWPAIHGRTLPTKGALCVVGFDEQNHVTVVWWEGPQSATAFGTATLVWAASTDSAILTIAHGLATTPTTILTSYGGAPGAGQLVSTWGSAPSSTTFKAGAHSSTSITATVENGLQWAAFA